MLNRQMLIVCISSTECKLLVQLYIYIPSVYILKYLAVNFLTVGRCYRHWKIVSIV